MYQRLVFDMGAQILLVPSAFTVTTGEPSCPTPSCPSTAALHATLPAGLPAAVCLLPCLLEFAGL